MKSPQPQSILWPLLALALSGCGAKVKEAEAFVLGTQAYLYGFPLVVMDVTRQVSTGVPSPQGARAPVNQFAHVMKYPDASFKDVVRANVDTLYSVVWLDLSREPQVLSVPNTDGHYYLMPILDAWTNVIASPGTRTTGSGAGTFAITGPDWKGTLPVGITEEIKSPTNMCWIIGRTQANGPKEYAVVNAIQKQYTITPLSAFGQEYSPPGGMPVDPNVDLKTPPLEQVQRMDAGDFFNRLALLLKANPPAAADAPTIVKLAKLGIEPGEAFEIAKVDPEIAAGLRRAARDAMPLLKKALELTGRKENGWSTFPPNIGNYGTDYKTRAAVALIGLGANARQDAVYPTAYEDGDGRPLDGANSYVLHFEKDATPPANAFWSLTMYDSESFFVPNPINRFNLAAWMPLKYNKDGSLDLFFQAKSPGKDKESNWLPSPASGAFSVTMRVYWPKEPALNGTWTPPPVNKLQ